jgi:hypothetical protein
MAGTPSGRCVCVCVCVLWRKEIMANDPKATSYNGHLTT